jgi:hypothetical protein
MGRYWITVITKVQLLPTLPKGQPGSNIFGMVPCMAKVPYKSRLAPTESDGV